ncbi:unnamed protein product, partial [Ectocarpus sp. 13 AM-2016]
MARDSTAAAVLQAGVADLKTNCAAVNGPHVCRVKEDTPKAGMWCKHGDPASVHSLTCTSTAEADKAKITFGFLFIGVAGPGGPVLLQFFLEPL